MCHYAMNVMYCTGTNDQPETSAEQLLTTVAELKSELLEVKSSKDRALKSLHEQESSSMLIQQQCRELEESCAELKSEKDKLLQKIALLHSHPGIWRVNSFHASGQHANSLYSELSNKPTYLKCSCGHVHSFHSETG